MDNQKLSGKKILIADDNPAIVDVLRSILEVEGFEVETTLRGERVGKMIQSRPDLLLLDVFMSGQDGRQICKALKIQDETRDIPIIMFSANKETEKSSKQAGASDFLEKPFDMKDLLEKVEYHIKQ